MKCVVHVSVARLGRQPAFSRLLCTYSYSCLCFCLPDWPTAWVYLNLRTISTSVFIFSFQMSISLSYNRVSFVLVDFFIFCSPPLLVFLFFYCICVSACVLLCLSIEYTCSRSEFSSYVHTNHFFSSALIRIFLFVSFFFEICDGVCLLFETISRTRSRVNARETAHCCYNWHVECDYTVCTVRSLARFYTFARKFRCRFSHFPNFYSHPRESFWIESFIIHISILFPFQFFFAFASFVCCLPKIFVCVVDCAAAEIALAIVMVVFWSESKASSCRAAEFQFQVYVEREKVEIFLIIIFGSWFVSVWQKQLMSFEKANRAKENCENKSSSSMQNILIGFDWIE